LYRVGKYLIVAVCVGLLVLALLAFAGLPTPPLGHPAARAAMGLFAAAAGLHALCHRRWYAEDRLWWVERLPPGLARLFGVGRSHDDSVRAVVWGGGALLFVGLLFFFTSLGRLN